MKFLIALLVTLFGGSAVVMTQTGSKPKQSTKPVVASTQPAPSAPVERFTYPPGDPLPKTAAADINFAGNMRKVLDLARLFYKKAPIEQYLSTFGDNAHSRDYPLDASKKKIVWELAAPDQILHWENDNPVTLSVTIGKDREVIQAEAAYLPKFGQSSKLQSVRELWRSLMAESPPDGFYSPAFTVVGTMPNAVTTIHRGAVRGIYSGVEVVIHFYGTAPVMAKVEKIDPVTLQSSRSTKLVDGAESVSFGSVVHVIRFSREVTPKVEKIAEEDDMLVGVNLSRLSDK